MLTRRRLTAAMLAALTGPRAAHAQQSRTSYRIGLLWSGGSPPSHSRMESFREGLRESGYREGQNVAIVVRHAEEGQHLRALAEELVGLRVNVIAAFGDLGPRMAQQATAVVPIVALADDFVGAGLAPSLARPGGNTTGVTIFSPELSAKRLTLLRELIPQVSRVAVLWDPVNDTQLKATEQAARALGVKLQICAVRSGNDVGPAFEAIKKERADALNILASPLLAHLQRVIMDSVARQKLPAIYQWKEHAQAGGLMSYGPALLDMWRQVARVVGKVLAGAKPADLPVERPSKFELAINVKTAKSLGLVIPPALLARADEVIE